MMETYYQVVEGEKPFISICAVLYEGKLGRDLSIMLQIENSSLGETGMFCCSDSLMHVWFLFV